MRARQSVASSIAAALMVVAGGCGGGSHPATSGTGGAGTGGMTVTPAGTLSFRTADYDSSPERDLAAVTVADLNGDGYLDVAGALRAGGVTVLLNDGRGGLLPGPMYLRESLARSIVARDLDGDGDVDLAIGCVNLDPVVGATVLFNDGDGTFANPLTLTLSDVVGGIAAGDVNGDRLADLIVLAAGGTIAAYLGDGTGGFSALPPTPTPSSCGQGVAVADLDGDGFDDVASACYTPAAFAVLYGSAQGLAAPAQVVAPAGDLARSIAAADVDGDGQVDLLLGTETVDGSKHLGYLQVFRNAGNRAFSPGGAYAGGETARAVAMGDLDGDGDADAVIADDHGGRRVDVLFNDGHGVFSSPSSAYGAGASPSSVALGDLDGDRLPEVLVASEGLAVLRNSGGGTFVAAPHIGGGGFVVAGDVDEDGFTDLVAADYQNGDAVLFAAGDGTFRAAATSAPEEDTSGVALADVNGDGHLDEIGIQYQPPRLQGDLNIPATNVALMIRLNDGHGSFGAPAFRLVGSDVAAVVAADFDANQLPDLVFTVRDAPGQVGILLNDGQGFLNQDGPRYPVTGPSPPATGDLNRDGRLDLIVASDSTGRVSVFLGTGAGGLADPVSYAAGGNPNFVVAADLDGDGKLDVASSNAADESVSVLLGRGDGTLAAAVAYPAASPRSLAASDLDGDGKLDLIVPGDQSLTVLTNAGGGTFQVGRRFDSCGRASSVVATDVNGDGRPDLVVGHADGGLCLLLNTSR